MGWSFDKYSVAAIVSTRDHQIPPKYGPGPDKMDGPVFEVRKKGSVIPGLDTFGIIFIFNQTKG